MDITLNPAVTADPDTRLGELLTTKQAAEQAGVAEGTIRYWACVGKLQAAGHVGRSPRYLLRDVARVELETRKTGRAPIRRDEFIAAQQFRDMLARKEARENAA